MNNTNTVAFITGGNRGIGLETARELGKAGITVVLGSRDSEKGEQAATSLRNGGIASEAIRFDATDPDSAQTAFDYFEKEYGKLDVLVNNAGILVEPFPGN